MVMAALMSHCWTSWYDYQVPEAVNTTNTHLSREMLCCISSWLWCVFILHYSDIVGEILICLCFYSQYSILMVILFTVIVKYLLHCIDLWEENPWENKAVYLLYLELATSMSHLPSRAFAHLPPPTTATTAPFPLSSPPFSYTSHILLYFLSSSPLLIKRPHLINPLFVTWHEIYFLYCCALCFLFFLCIWYIPHMVILASNFIVPRVCFRF